MGFKTICKTCKKHKKLYKHRLCRSCTADYVMEKQMQMTEKRGPAWESWKKGMQSFLDDDNKRAEKLVVKRSPRKRPKAKPKSKKVKSKR